VSEWREVPIGELMAEFHDGPHATPKPSTDGPVFLGIKNLTDAGNLDLSAVRHIAPANGSAAIDRTDRHASAPSGTA
jgi:type I restriction enzyme, S subunit